MSELVKNKYFDFAFMPDKCSVCDAKCCKGESGYVFVNFLDIINISKYLKINKEDFAFTYLRKINNQYFSLKEIKLSEDNYACEFLDLDTNRCTIYEVRPKQCIKFPFWESHKKNGKNKKKVKEECMAIIDL
jgi:Fe-S-cluster containining protein